MAKKTKLSQSNTRKPSAQTLMKAPEEYVFRCNDGSIFRDIKDLAQGLATMPDETFAYHANAEKNDFSNWVGEVLKDEGLASDLGNKSQAAAYAEARLGALISQLA